MMDAFAYPEVGRACGEDDPVRADDGVVGAGPEGDVDEGLLLEQRVEDREDGRAVVVPLQAELLLGRRTAPYWEKNVKIIFSE